MLILALNAELTTEPAAPLHAIPDAKCDAEPAADLWVVRIELEQIDAIGTATMDSYMKSGEHPDTLQEVRNVLNVTILQKKFRL